MWTNDTLFIKMTNLTKHSIFGRDEVEKKKIISMVLF